MSRASEPVRIPPHNLDAERAILGAALIEGREALPSLVETVRPSDFYTEAHRVVCQGMLALFEAGEPVDLQTVQEHLRRTGELPLAGGPAGLALLMEVGAVAAYVPSYATIVRDLGVQREMIQLGTWIVDEAFRAQGAVRDLIATAENRIVTIAKRGLGHQALDESPHLVLDRLSDVQPEEVDWLWPNHLALGKITTVIGDPGVGKSFVTLDAAARVSRGTDWPDGTPAQRGAAILLSAEDGVADTIKPRLAALEADDSQIWVLRAVQAEDTERPFSLQRDLPLLEAQIIEKKPKLLIIDPASAYLGKTDSFRDAEVRALLAPLAALAEKYGVAIVAIMHLTKNEDRRAIARGNGSIAFVAAARIVLVVAKDPKDEGRRLLVGVKNNLGPMPPALAFKIVGEPACTAWEPLPVKGVDADSLLQSHVGRGRGDKVREAEEFLREYLADGSMPANEVEAAADARGISQRTLTRAASNLGIDKAKSRELRGPWHWMLPAGESKNAKLLPGADEVELATFGQDHEVMVESTPPPSKVANCDKRRDAGSLRGDQVELAI